MNLPAADLLELTYIRFAKNFSVYDGDSVKADIDEGDYRWEQQRPLRLFGIDAPEVNPLRRNYDGDEDGRMAERAAAVRSKERLVAYIHAADGPVLVQTVKLAGEPVRDKYGRTLARIFVKVNEKWVNVADRLLAEGHARPYDGGTKVEKWVPLRSLERVDAHPSLVV